MPTQSVYLTFDDGPHPTATPEVLQVLQSHKVAATFFLTGQNIAGNESLVREIATEGHTIGVHGFRHSRAPAFSKEKTRSEILHTEEALYNITPLSKKIFRPPFGFFFWQTISATKDLGYQIIMWTALTGDFRQQNNSRVISTALRHLSAGSVLVFHDNDRTRGKIGPIVSECLQRIQESGYSLAAI